MTTTFQPKKTRKPLERVFRSPWPQRLALAAECGGWRQVDTVTDEMAAAGLVRARHDCQARFVADARWQA